jgi:hypothetical protein
MDRVSLPNKNVFASKDVKLCSLRDCLYLGDIIKVLARRCLWQLICNYTIY